MTPSKTLLVGLTATAGIGLGIVWSTGSSADTHSPRTTVSSSAVVTPTAGRVLAGNCFQCHGTNGKGGPWESLAGKSANETYNEMKEMQSGSEGGGIMSVHAQSYSDAQLRAIADFFSKVK